MIRIPGICLSVNRMIRVDQAQGLCRFMLTQFDNAGWSGRNSGIVVEDDGRAAGRAGCREALSMEERESPELSRMLGVATVSTTGEPVLSRMIGGAAGSEESWTIRAAAGAEVPWVIPVAEVTTGAGATGWWYPTPRQRRYCT